MSVIANHNYSSGTFNNVVGNQINNFTGAIVLFSSRRTSTQVQSSLRDMEVSERYQDIVSNIAAVCDLLRGFMNQPFAPGYLLVAIEKEMKEFSKFVVYVARVLDIIDKIPGKLKHLRRFKDIASLVSGYNSRLHEMFRDIDAYKTHLHTSTPPGFLRGLWLYIFSYHRWGRLSAEMGQFLEKNREVLEGFLHFLTSRSWRNIFPEEHGKELEKLILEAGLQPEPSLRHLQVLKIIVRDHLGRRLPIPMEFCTSWPDFEIVVKHFCRNVEGGDFVQRDHWEVVRAADNALIDKSRFMSILKPEVELDISIVFWMLASSLFVCPGCQHENPRRDTRDGWINCYNCDKYFRIIHTLPHNRMDARAEGSEQPSNERRRKLGLSAHSDTHKTSQRRSKGHMHSISILKHIRELGKRRGATPLKAEGPTNMEVDLQNSHNSLDTPGLSASNFLRVSVRVQEIMSRPTTSPPSTSDSNRRQRDVAQTDNPVETREGSQREEIAADASLLEPPPVVPSAFKWLRGELLRRDSFSRSYLALNVTTGEMFVAKQVEIFRMPGDKGESAAIQALKLESERMKDLEHPNIVQYLGFEETPTLLSIFLEFVPGGTIGQILRKGGKFDEDVTKSFTAQILDGLEYIHSKGIFHGGLKGDSVLLEESGVCKISDFGLSRRTDDPSEGLVAPMQVSLFWMAPEVTRRMYSSKIDIWGVGCAVLEMWTGVRPWYEEEASAVFNKHYQNKFVPPVPEDIVLSSLADDFRRKCFALNPDERPTASELRMHEYLTLPDGWAFHGLR